MDNATVLYCADLDTPDDAVQRAADVARERNQHLAVLLYAPNPTLPMSAYGSMPYGGVAVPDDWVERLNAARDELHDRVDAIERLVAQTGASADVRPLFVSGADIKTGVAASARTADVALFAPNLRQNTYVFKELLHGVIFHAPISAYLNTPSLGDARQVVLAWNDSLASARAAHRALPLLKDAHEVHVVWFDPPAVGNGREREPGREVSAWLSHHGCKVTLEQMPSRGKEVGACIVDLAREKGSDLVVMGAYGHSRLQQAVFGGTSRTMIDQTEIPVLLAH